MRIRFSTSCAGDIRLQYLRDRKHSEQEQPARVAPLVCSSKFQDLKRRILRRYAPGFGTLSTRNRFGKDARRTVRYAGAILDRASLARVVFLTGTLPGSTEESYRALAEWSGWVVRTLGQWLRDTKYGAKYFGVWEWQRRGALHLHVAVECPSAEKARELKRAWKKRWIRLLDGIVARTNVDLYRRDVHRTWRQRKWVTRTDAQTVEKSVGSYLSKYLGKGSCKTRSGCYFPPSSWYFVSKNVQQEISQSKRCTTVQALQPTTAQNLFERIGGLVAAEVSKCFPYWCTRDAVQKGIVALAKPIHASMLYDHISSLLVALGASREESGGNLLCSQSEVAAIFWGRIL